MYNYILRKRDEWRPFNEEQIEVHSSFNSAITKLVTLLRNAYGDIPQISEMMKAYDNGTLMDPCFAVQSPQGTTFYIIQKIKVHEDNTKEEIITEEDTVVYADEDDVLYHKEEKSVTDISKIAYELYKLDWKINHGITHEREMREILRYFHEFGSEEENGYSYEDYLNDYGYGGQIYVCYNEFLNTEYQDKDYILNLLKQGYDKESECAAIKYMEDLKQ